MTRRAFSGLATLPALALPACSLAWLACLAGLALPLSGCHDGAASSPPASAAGSAAAGSEGKAEGAASGETLVRLENDGQTLDVPVGGSVVFKLASNAGTGYGWKFTRLDPAMLTPQGAPSTEVSSDTPGAPKLDVSRFTAAAAGSTDVEASLVRPFGNAPPGRTIHVTLHVH